MNKGIGVGSASIVLVFAVLCLTIFTLITLTSAENDMAMASAEARLVKGYYEADTLAQLILADILRADAIPASVRGVEILSRRQENARIVTFSCPISDRKELYVSIAIDGDSYNIRDWHMRDTVRWEMDANLSVWAGN